METQGSYNLFMLVSIFAVPYFIIEIGINNVHLHMVKVYFLIQPADQFYMV